MLRRLLAVILTFSLVSMSFPVWGATPQPQTMSEILGEVERSLYGDADQKGDGGLIARLLRIEVDIFGEAQTGDIQSRINILKAMAIGGSGISLLMKLNVVEWVVFGRLVAGSPLLTRLVGIEKEFYGTAKAGPLEARIQDLVSLLWSSGTFETAQVTVPVRTPVKVKLQAPINSKSAKPGDEVPFIVSDSVMVEGKVVIPSGTVAKGRVLSVKAASFLGQSGDVIIEFGKVFTMDGKQVTLLAGVKGEQSSTTELVAGASLLGLVTLGPLGLAAGVFIKGQEMEVSAGVEMTLYIAQEISVQGLSLEPSK